MKENLHLKSYDIETLPPDLVDEIRRTFTIFDVDNGKLKTSSLDLTFVTLISEYTYTGSAWSEDDGPSVRKFVEHSVINTLGTLS